MHDIHCTTYAQEVGCSAVHNGLVKSQGQAICLYATRYRGGATKLTTPETVEMKALYDQHCSGSDAQDSTLQASIVFYI